MNRIFLILLLVNVLLSCSKNDEFCTEKTWYIDVDKDGFGDQNNKISSCIQPKSYVDNNTDCDDSNNMVHPNTSEIHNDIDDNCNGIIDECSSDFDCNGTCVNAICVEDMTPFVYEFTEHSFTHDLTSLSIPYHFFEPEQSQNSSEKFPLIIALHGAEYFYSSKDFFLTGEVAEMIGYFALGWIKENKQQQYPAYVVAPNIHVDLSSTYERWSSDKSLDLVDDLLQHLIASNPNIDNKRIYITGHSMGGDGTWYIGTKLNTKIAALVPLSNALSNETVTYVTNEINNGIFADLPVWKFIHKKDEGEESRQLFNELKSQGYEMVYTHSFENDNYNLSTSEIEQKIDEGNIHFYTEYSYACSLGECHFAMTRAIKEPLLFKWLFKQKRN